MIGVGLERKYKPKGRKSASKHSNKSKKHMKPSHHPEQSIPVWPMYLLLVVLVAVYIFARSTGPLVLIVIVIIIVMEVVNVIRSESSKKGLLELAIAVAAVLLIWAILIVALGTTTPLDVVPSCSMLPKLNVGDMIIVQNSGISGIHATTVNVSKNAMDAYLNKTSTSTYECIAYDPSNPSRVSQYVLPGYSVGLYSYDTSSGTYTINANQSHNLIQFNCGTAQVMYKNGTAATEAYTSSITVNGTVIHENLNNSVLVYKTEPSDLFYKEGDRYVVHRAYAVINAQGAYYVLTKGDNNPGLDIQYMNVPPGTKYIEGKVISSIPYIGYIKIILSGLREGAGCNSVVLH